MSKYQLLSERLAARTDAVWRAGFAELEEVLGFALPKAARSTGAWWANTPDKAHARAWLDQGWEASQVDREAETVTFRRVAAAVAEPVAKAPAETRALGMTALVGAAAAVLGVAFSLLRRRR
ncbi:MAG: hypothetical protein Q8M88_04920 [Phenylobacterium sp.]|uniref:DUF7662 domain-containing protein n=1 Tax=Phenylobacterium sp. TaxID=1871053 RepID=UPI002736B159|nr:hypothetical protein [Phenylobacterium sp.]MDP3173756.1 hypothetical protein [Phenylobacterium sp.]